MKVDSQDDIHLFETPDEAFQYLRYVGTLEDEDINLAEASLALALVFLPGVHIDRYRQHFKKLSDHVREEFASRLRLKEEDTLFLRARILRKIIHEAHGYKADTKGGADIEGSNMIRVIERRMGGALALGFFYIILARLCDWEAEGLNFPGHFIMRLEKGGERLILDPFQEGMEMQAADLRGLLKSAVGGSAELSHDYYKPILNREMLLRLQNSLKKYLIDTEEYAQAILVLESMTALAPEDCRPLFDTGVLYAKLGQNQQAKRSLEHYIEKTQNPQDRRQAQALLAQISAQL